MEGTQRFPLHNTQTRHTGRIRSSGVEKDGSFVKAPDSLLHPQIDAANRKKYRRYPAEYVNAWLTSKSQAPTCQLVPRD